MESQADSAGDKGQATTAQAKAIRRRMLEFRLQKVFEAARVQKPVAAFFLLVMADSPHAILGEFSQARTSSTRQAVTRSDSLTGAGKVPAFTLRQRVAPENGTTAWIKYACRT
jgi:hypothetical protein